MNGAFCKSTLLFSPVITLIGIPLFGLSSDADAEMATLEYSIRFGDVAPVGGAPYATAVFDDGDNPGSVTLTVSVLGTVGMADITDLYFNLDPLLDPLIDQLNIERSLVGNIGFVGPEAIKTGVNGFKADGDGKYDIEINLPPPPGSGDPDPLFNAGETLV